MKVAQLKPALGRMLTKQYRAVPSKTNLGTLEGWHEHPIPSIYRADTISSHPSIPSHPIQVILASPIYPSSSLHICFILGVPPGFCDPVGHRCTVPQRSSSYIPGPSRLSHPLIPPHPSSRYPDKIVCSPSILTVCQPLRYTNSITYHMSH